MLYRCDSNGELEYGRLKSRLVDLFNESSVAVLAKKTVNDLAWCVDSQPNVWTDLLNDVEFICKSDRDALSGTCI